MFTPDPGSELELVDQRVPFSNQRPVAGLAEQVALALEEAILLGKLRSGERIVEADVATQMGTSNGPVREALRELEDLGLIVSAPRRGTFVTELTAQLARDVFSLRALLEVAALRLAIRRLSSRDVGRFQEVLEQMGRYPDGPSSSPRLLVDWDLRFHDILFDLSGHRLLQQSWQRIRVQARVLLIVTGALWNAEARSAQERAEGMVEVHAPLVEGIQMRDLALAESRFVEHLAEGERRILLKMTPGDHEPKTLVDTLLRPAASPDGACTLEGAP